MFNVLVDFYSFTTKKQYAVIFLKMSSLAYTTVKVIWRGSTKVNIIIWTHYIHAVRD